MSSVTKRISEVSQPRGGYVPISLFTTRQIEDNKNLNSDENIAPTIIGLCVDYLTRYMSGDEKDDAFKISLSGALILDELLASNIVFPLAASLLQMIQGLDDESIVAACKLCCFDVVYRAGIKGYKPIDDIQPDKNTIENIRIMVERSLCFLSEYGPKTLDGFTFEGGYSKTVTTGDGDFLTADTLWDFKVSKANITSKHTLQLLMYYIMGKHSIHPEFQSIHKLGVFNPRLNTVYLLPVSEIPHHVIEEVERNVICYENLDTPLIIPNISRNNNNLCNEKSVYEIVENRENHNILNMQDLILRYRCSPIVIQKGMIPRGLPHSVKDNSYQFNIDEVVEWEKKEKSIQYENYDRIVLPGYLAQLNELNDKLEIAKKNREKRRVRRLKKEIAEYSLVKPMNYVSTKTAVLIILFFAFLCLWYLKLLI